jgi:hypothetical protein
MQTHLPPQTLIREKQMLRAVVAAALAIAAITSAALAQSSGNAACDDFVKKVEACLPKVPAAERGTYKEMVDQLKKQFTDVEFVRKSAVGHCTDLIKPNQKALSTFYGCTF